jgi:thioredoxin 1
MKHVDFGDVELVSIDIEEQSDKAQQFGIRGVPTIVLLEDGKEVKRKSGVLMADQIEDFIK